MAQTPPDLRMRRRRLVDRYEMVVRRGSGGMAEVWEGVDHNLGRKIAIKVLHAHLAENPSILSRFRSEAQAAARLTHPGIVAIYDTVTTEDTDAIIMELVEGRDLRTLLDERPTLALTDAAEVGVQLAAALGHAHHQNIIHRDVKPANILVRPDRRVKLSDFGIAKALDQTSHTESGSLVGTVKYLAPEQLEGRVADGRTDLYSLTTLLYEMLCGEVPFAASDLMGAMKRVQVDPPSARILRPDLPPAFDSFLLRGLARDPNNRYPNAQAWSTALTQSINNDATVADAPLAPAAPAQSIPMRPSERHEEVVVNAPVITPTPQQQPAPEPARVAGADSPRRAPAKADPAVAKHHQRNRGRLALLGPVIALALTAAAVVTVWLLLRGATNSVDSADDPNADATLESNTVEAVEGVEEIDPDVPETTVPETVTTEGQSAGSEPTSPTDGAAPDTPETTTTTTTVVADFVGGQRAIAFDPIGGDGEHDDIAVRALDGDLSTFWNTQSYRTREFGNIKEGVGLIVEFEDPRDIGELSISTDRIGWAARVYSADTVATDLAGWGNPVGEFTDLGVDSTLDVGNSSALAVLVWVTDLGIDPEQSAEQYDAQVAEGGFDQRLVINEITVQG